MIVVDTSAVIAIAWEEPVGDSFLQILAREPDLTMSAVNWLETRIVFTAAWAKQACFGCTI